MLGERCGGGAGADRGLPAAAVRLWRRGSLIMTGALPGERLKWRMDGIDAIILLVLLTLRSIQKVEALVNSEGIALASFKDGIVRDPSGVLRNWNTEDPTPCSWKGVTCDAQNRVVRLLLNDVGLAGTISGSLNQLTSLRTLSLSQNAFTGSIPSDLSTMGALYKLNLSLNALSGPVPAAIGNLTGLRMLDLSGNSLSGSLASQLFQDCHRLRYINLSRNILYGTIPATLGSCASLSGIDLSQNQLQGSIPAELGNLQELLWLSLDRNFLSGRIPTALGNSSALESLNLGGNSLSGSLPDELGDLRNLSSLGLQDNFLTGNVSATVLFKPNVVRLNLSNNFFSEEIPPPIGNACGMLQSLDLSRNHLSGPIPSILGSCSRLRDLRLSSNQLSSSIPLSLTQLLNLEILDLSFNNLTGTIPAQVGILTGLRSLRLNDNPISGPIPVEIGELGQMQILNLENMKLDGSITSSLASLVSLSTLDISNNTLTGTIPEALNSLANLTHLDVSLNMLNGNLSNGLGGLAKLQDLDLSNNSFTGMIPDSLGSLPDLTGFNVSFNNLTGLVPTAGTFRRFNDSSYLGNPGLCGSPLGSGCASNAPVRAPTAPPAVGGTPGKAHDLSWLSIFFISAAALIALGVLLVTIVNVRAIRKRRHRDFLIYESSPPSPDISPIVGKLVLFSRSIPSSREDWEAGTKALLDKDCMIGKGSLGSVYKATFDGGQSIAVKKLDTLGRIKNQEDFEHEMGILGNLKPHPNLVPLQGYYWSSAMQLLLSDFVPNDSLHYHLHEEAGAHTSLRWRRRFRIALGTARGLAYLHHDCKPPIFHFDLKVSNILLDDDFEPRVTDYGLGKLLPMLDTYISSRKFHTTLGYVAPELACQGIRLTEKCDVYSFGMVLLELVTGRQPVESFENRVIVLGEFVRTSLEHGGRVSTCMDPRLDASSENEIMQVLKLGLICTSENPTRRPTMSEVVQVLESIKTSSTSSRAVSAPTSVSASSEATSVSPSP